MAEKSGVRLFGQAEAAAFFGVDLLKYEDCALWIVSRLHPESIKCPHCAEPLHSGTAQANFLRFKQVRCAACKKKYTAATGTIMNGAKLDVVEIYLLAVLSDLGVSAARIAGVLKCHVDTVHNWQQHFAAHAELASA